VKIAHVADIHLGRRQYNYDQRATDARLSFDSFLNETRDADAVVIPGDLFDSRDIRPETLEATEEALDDLDRPVFVSPGNHDQNMSRQRKQTWLEYLNNRGLVTLLSADLAGDRAGFAPTDATDPRPGGGGYVDLHKGGEHVRLFGFQYRGAYTADEIERVAEGIEAVKNAEGAAETTILLAHFGVENAVPDLGANVSRADLTPLEDVVDRLLLGHIHKQYESVGFAYNPGSLEAFDVGEGRWDGHGYYVHDTTTGETSYRHSKRRPYHTLRFDVTGYQTYSELRRAFEESLSDAASSVKTTCAKEIHQAGDGSRRDPIVNVRFEGTLELGHSAFDVNELTELTETRLEAFHVQPTDGTERQAVQELLGDLDREEAFSEDGTVETGVLQDRVFETLAEESQYGGAAESVAETLSETEQLVTDDGEGTASVAEFLRDRRRELFPDGPGGEADGTDTEQTDETDTEEST
jgi:DNA repair exonuclease SbcCD nuclease subunit